MSFILTAGARQIDLSAPICMGILNTTPDSFSDGSNLAATTSSTFRVDIDKALRLAETMCAEGAAILDIGGESTRPGAEEVSLQEEMDRVLPVVAAIHQRIDVCISVDSSSPELMTAAIEAGAGLVNDVRALNRSGALEAVVHSGAAVCLMHMQGQPGTMQDKVEYSDVVQQVSNYLGQRLAVCREAGISNDRLLIDPGFGFGKTVEHNFQLLKSLSQFAVHGQPLLVGISRKSMLGAVTGRDVNERLAASVAAATLALQGGAKIIRSHDVAATMDAIRVHCAFASE